VRDLVRWVHRGQRTVLNAVEEGLPSKELCSYPKVKFSHFAKEEEKEEEEKEEEEKEEGRK